MAEPKPENIEKSARMLTREQVGQEAKDAGFQLDAIIEGRLKEDNIFILRPIVPDAPESRDRQKVRSLREGYLARAKTAKGGKSPRDYAVSLERIPSPMSSCPGARCHAGIVPGF